MSEWADEIETGERFAFGDNWRRFLPVLDEARISDAIDSLRQMLGVDNLQGKRFLDAGSGSGLFSLAARRLGASVVSFDYDPSSVACTEELRRRYFPADEEWRVLEGSVLDESFLADLGDFDVVYSWGVLHHTGAMWTALERLLPLVREGGLLYISIYNDQGWQSAFWTSLKRRYNSGGRAARWTILHGTDVAFRAKTALGGVHRALLRTQRPAKDRGMDRWYDLVDWVGGYPFEVAKPEEVFEFCKDRGLTLERMVTCGGGLGCNSFVFTRI